jgi:hypothetical protein
MKKQGQTAFFVLCLLAAAPLATAKPHFAAAPSATHASGGGAGHGGGMRRAGPRKAPPMAPNRRVTEQDCSKPVDLSAGNLKCK